MSLVEATNENSALAVGTKSLDFALRTEKSEDMVLVRSFRQSTGTDFLPEKRNAFLHHTVVFTSGSLERIFGDKCLCRQYFT